MVRLSNVLLSGLGLEGKQVFLVSWGMEYLSWMGAMLVSVSHVFQDWPWSGVGAMSDQEFFLS